MFSLLLSCVFDAFVFVNAQGLAQSLFFEAHKKRLYFCAPPPEGQAVFSE
jgi:hypothetical protein